MVESSVGHMAEERSPHDLTNVGAWNTFPWTGQAFLRPTEQLNKTQERTTENLETAGVTSSEGREGFPGGSVVKNPPINGRDMDSIPDLGRPPHATGS